MPAGPSAAAQSGQSESASEHSASARVTSSMTEWLAPDRPVFVGGTGRSGTTIAGRLLGRHHDLRATNPRELRFIASRGGVADAYAGKVTPQQVVDSLWEHWYVRVKPSGARSGLFRRLDEQQMRAACEVYVASFAEDPAQASRHFAESIVSSGRWSDAQSRGEGKSRWVDTTPANARAADRVLALFPDGVVVHMMRDGRDVAASFVSKPFGPADVFTALEEWRERMIEAHHAEQACPAGRFVRVDLHELTVTDREATLTALLEAIGVGPDRRLSQWFDANVLPQQAHIGRWRRDYDDATAARIDARYDEILAEFDAAGVPYPRS
jgi:hypothetical protein